MDQLDKIDDINLDKTDDIAFKHNDIREDKQVQDEVQLPYSQSTLEEPISSTLVSSGIT